MVATSRFRWPRSRWPDRCSPNSVADCRTAGTSRAGMTKQIGRASALQCLSRRPQPPFARGDGYLPLPKPVRSAILATKPPVSGECRFDLAPCRGMQRGRAAGSPCQGAWYYHAHLGRGEHAALSRTNNEENPTWRK
jgi:hypothetical protein